MKDMTKLCRAVSQVAVGHVFLYLNVNLGPINLLPNVVGYLLILCAIGVLVEEVRELALLRPLTILLAVWSGLDWVLAWMGASLQGRFLPLDIVVALASLYFQFQLLTDMAQVAERYQQVGDRIGSRLLLWRNVQTVIQTLAMVIPWVAACVSRQMQQLLGYGGALAALCGVVAAAATILELFALKKRLRQSSWGE